MRSVGTKVLCATTIAMSGFVLATPAEAVGILTFTNKAAWLAALPATAGTLYTEDFNDGVFNDGTVTSQGGGAILANQWADTVDTNPNWQTQWTFDNPLIAWGAEWNLIPGNAGQGLNILIGFNGSTQGVLPFNPTIPNTTTGFSFFGIVSDSSFTSVIVQADGQAGQNQAYQMDNMVYVPEPSSLILLGLGFGAMALIRKRRSDG